MENLLENVPLMSGNLCHDPTGTEHSSLLTQVAQSPPVHKHDHTSGTVPATHIPATKKQQNMFISYWKFNPFFY